MAADLAIETVGLTRTFGKLRAVDDLTLAVPRGIVFGFLGPNGAGKTTTIRLLLGLVATTAGSARVLGLDVGREGGAIRAHSGALLEHTGLYERLTALENLEFYGRAYRIPGGERDNRIRDLLTRFGLWDRRGDRVDGWSRGMKQKLAVARAILHRPGLIFLDEPTAGLDPVAAAALRDDLSRLVAGGETTVFLTTHNLPEAEKLCTLVGVIDRGRLLAVGRPDELRGRARTAVEIAGEGFTPALIGSLEAVPGVRGIRHRNGHLTVETGTEVDPATLVTMLVTGGAAVREVRSGSSSLEDAFLALLNEVR